ncbi:unnamed protein product [Sphagnum compactum]
MTASATAEASSTHRATRIQPQHGTAINAEAITSQRSKLFSLDDEGGLSDSDPDPSDDDGCSSEDEQRRSHTSKHSRWSDLDEQRLLAYKLDPQYVHAGTWSGPEATKLPPAGTVAGSGVESEATGMGSDAGRNMEKLTSEAGMRRNLFIGNN